MHLQKRIAVPRLPRHIGLIPDGNRRWAESRGLLRDDGYSAGVAPGLRTLERCRQLGIDEVTAYGFTRENVKRPAVQVRAFRNACVALAAGAVAAGAALLVVGDTDSPVFPEELRPFSGARTPGGIRFNLLVNYNWQWDLERAIAAVRPDAPTSLRADFPGHLGSRGVSRIDLVIRWGGRRRLSGFVPLQTAYADIYVVDSLWPDMTAHELDAALEWYARQEVTLGG